MAPFPNPTPAATTPNPVLGAPKTVGETGLDTSTGGLPERFDCLLPFPVTLAPIFELVVLAVAPMFAKGIDDAFTIFHFA